MTKLKPTPEQEAIITAATTRGESLMISAYAGCAKTSTLEMIAAAMPPSPAMALAFNVKIKTELEKRFPSHFKIMTLNGLGHVAWGRAIRKKLTLDDKKLGKLVSEEFRSSKWEGAREDWDTVRNLVTKAMQAGIVPKMYPQKGLVPDSFEQWQALWDEELPPNLIILAQDVLIRSVKQGFEGTISFDDQIYLSAMFGGVFPRVPLLLVDEAQDLSPLNHIQVQRSAGGRLIVVGDPKQAIYAFRGADSKSMSKLRGLRPEWIDLPLTTTFRCPQVVVARQQEHAPGFTAGSANAEGLFEKWNAIGEDGAKPQWGVAKLNGAPEIAILCRNNAPLLSMAFKLLKQHIPVHMLGRDIGKGLVVLSKKILKEDALPREKCAETITKWMERECSLATANGKEERCEGITDRGECLLAVLEGEGINSAGDLRSALERLFARDSGKITLSSGHRSKGLEFHTVIVLDPWRIPSRFAKAEALLGNTAALEQERNLSYVMETRAKHTLIHANVEDFS